MSQVLRIVVASPDDVSAERECVAEVLTELNASLAPSFGFDLKLSRWETDTHPGFHPDGPPGLIDPILKIEDCDIFIGIFWKRFGTPVHDAGSGTEHEFWCAYRAWQKKRAPEIMFYFNQQPYAPKLEEEARQWAQVLKFKNNFPEEGLSWDYNGKTHFEKVLREHLTGYLTRRYRLLSDFPRGSAIGKARSHDREDADSVFRNLETLVETYRARLLETVGKVYIFGESAPRDLKRMFVDLTINEEYERPLMYSESAGRMALDPRLHLGSAGDDSRSGVETRQELPGKKKRTIKPEELLLKEANVVIIGAPGCGKTTLLRYLALRTQEENKQFPLFLELKTLTAGDLKRANYNLADLLFNKAVAGLMQLRGRERARERKRLKEYFLARLAEGKVAIFLDGLDEISGMEFFSPLCQSIREFVQSEYSETSIVISSRPQSLESRFERFKEVEIAPLNQRQIGDFLDHYYGDKVAKRFVQMFYRNSQLRELMRVPFLLAVIVRLHRKQNIIVEDRLELYRQIVLHLAFKLDQEKSVVRSHFQLKDPKGLIKLDFLKRLAYERLIIDYVNEDSEKQVDAGAVFTAKVIVEKAKRFLGEGNLSHLDPYALVSDVVATPLLREVGADTYAFAHLTIQEYLAAEGLSEQKDCAKRFCQIYFNPSLAESEVLPMTLGLVAHPQELYALLEDLPESLNALNFRIRARGLGYATQIDQQTLQGLSNRLSDLLAENETFHTAYRDPIMQSFYASGGKSVESIASVVSLHLGNTHVTDSALALLGQMGGQAGIAKLVEVLKHSDVSLRTKAAELLGHLGGETATQALISALTDQYTAVRANAAEALGQIGDEQAVDGLVSAALGDPEMEVSLRAVAALERIKGESATGALVAALQKQHLEVRCHAALALGQRSGATALAALIEAATGGGLLVRLSAIDGLAEVEDEKAAAMLIAALEDDDFLIRLRAAGALARVKGGRAFGLLSDALSCEHSEVRSRVVVALEQVGGERSIPALTKVLADDDASVRAIAAETLGNIGTDRAVTSLVMSSQDSDSAVRLASLVALGKIGGATAIARLVELLNDEKLAVREKAVTMLGQLGGDQAIAALLVSLHSSAARVCSRAIIALGNLKEARAVGPLLEQLKHESSYVRGCAADALAQIGQDSSVELLTQALADDDVYARGRVAAALGSLGGQQALAALLPYTKDPCVYVRLRVVNSLGLIARAEAVEALIEALDDDELEVRVTAADALAKIGGERALDALLASWEKDYSDSFRRNWRSIAGAIWTKAERSAEKLAGALGDWDVQLSAVDALGELGTEDAVIPLLETIESRQADLVYRAALALGRMESKPLARGLVMGLYHPSDLVRRKASESVGYYDQQGEALEKLADLALLDPHPDVQSSAQEAVRKYKLKRAYLDADWSAAPQLRLQEPRKQPRERAVRDVVQT